MIAPWPHWRPASCMPDACFCEAIREGWVRQPANTASSLAFVAAAVLVLRVAARGDVGVRRLAAPFAIALLVIGSGSAFYHASLSFAGQFVDVFGMYLVATLMIAVNLRRRHSLPGAWLVPSYGAANALLALALYALPSIRRPVFASLIVLAVALEAWRPAARGGGRRLGAAIALLGAGFALWVLDITRVVCAPDSWLQGHAAWHVLGAAAAWQLWRYYEGLETVEPPRRM